MKLILATTIPATLYNLYSNQLPYLINQGYDIELITSSGKGWITAIQLKEKYNLPVHVIPFTRKISFFSDIVCFFKIKKIIKKTKPDIIHYSTPKASLICALSGFFYKKSIKIYTIRGIVYYEKKGPLYYLLLLCEKLTCFLSHFVICVSKSNMNYIIGKKICNVSKIGILGYGSSQGVDANIRFNPANIDNKKVIEEKIKLNISNKEVVFGFMGRLTREKGLKELIEAWEMLTKEKPDIVLIIIGPVDFCREKVDKKLISIIKNAQTIRIIGNVNNPELYYKLMDVHILPSYREGFPNTVLEASAMEIPTITTNATGCIDSVIDGVTGFIVPAKNSIELYKKMLILANNDILRKQMGKKARERVVKYYNPELICKDLIYIFDNKKLPEIRKEDSI